MDSMLGALVLTTLVAAAPRPGDEQVMQDIQRAHIDANVPAPEDFDRFLRRDLAGYFAQVRKQKSVVVDFQLLRNGPTQSGVAYPKYYAWVRIAGGTSAKDRGAVRVAAIDGTRFEVTSFVSEEAIQADPAGLRPIFPAPVCDRIAALLRGETELVLFGTVVAIGPPTTDPLRPWNVTVRVDKVLSGELSAPTATFNVHSPAQFGLVVGRPYAIKAKRTSDGVTTIDQVKALDQPEAPPRDAR